MRSKNNNAKKEKKLAENNINTNHYLQDLRKKLVVERKPKLTSKLKRLPVVFGVVI